HSPHYPVSLCTLSTDLLILPRSLTSPLFPYTPLFRSCAALPPSPPRPGRRGCRRPRSRSPGGESPGRCPGTGRPWSGRRHFSGRSEERRVGEEWRGGESGDHAEKEKECREGVVGRSQA